MSSLASYEKEAQRWDYTGIFYTMNSRILETILIDWSKLKDLQPEGIKTSENEQALRESLQKYGFVVPFYVWKDSKGVLWTIDGHTRKKVLKDMQAPEMLQATLIQAKNKKEAQEMLIEEMYVNDVVAGKATKGDDCTLKLPFRIRMSDKLYKR